MSRKQDKQLEQLEQNLTALYADAAKEVGKEFSRFTETFEAKDIEMAKKVKEGTLSDAEYELWRQKNILQSDMYQATINKLTDTIVKADIAAMALVNNEMPKVAAESYNFGQALGWKAAQDAGISAGTFQVYNARSIQKLLKGSKILRDVDIPEDKKWNKNKITKAISTSILKGDSIPKTADRLQGITDMDRNAAIRNARTCMTAAENMGRMEAADNMRAKGIPVDEVWSCIHDKRTRETHIMLDGTKRNEQGYFGEGIINTPLRFPADPDGDPEEIYNCRCRTSIVLQGIDHSNDDALYEQFMKENDPKSYEAIRERDGAKESAFQMKKARAEEKRRK